MAATLEITGKTEFAYDRLAGMVGVSLPEIVEEFFGEDTDQVLTLEMVADNVGIMRLDRHLTIRFVIDQGAWATQPLSVEYVPSTPKLRHRTNGLWVCKTGPAGHDRYGAQRVKAGWLVSVPGEGLPVEEVPTLGAAREFVARHNLIHGRLG